MKKSKLRQIIKEEIFKEAKEEKILPSNIYPRTAKLKADLLKYFKKIDLDKFEDMSGYDHGRVKKGLDTAIEILKKNKAIK